MTPPTQTTYATIDIKNQTIGFYASVLKFLRIKNMIESPNPAIIRLINLQSIGSCIFLTSRFAILLQNERTDSMSDFEFIEQMFDFFNELLRFKKIRAVTFKKSIAGENKSIQFKRQCLTNNVLLTILLLRVYKQFQEYL